MAWQGLLGKL